MTETERIIQKKGWNVSTSSILSWKATTTCTLYTSIQQLELRSANLLGDYVGDVYYIPDTRYCIYSKVTKKKSSNGVCDTHAHTL